MTLPLPATISYCAFGLLASVFYGLKAFDVFLENRPSNKWAYCLHQFWFNFLGSSIGWLTGLVIFAKLWHFFQFSDMSVFTWSDLVVGAIAFVGITGHIPFATFGILRGLRDLALRVVEAVK